MKATLTDKGATGAAGAQGMAGRSVSREEFEDLVRRFQILVTAIENDGRTLLPEELEADVLV